ncbi:MAG: SDR family oxidoreductase, partial [Kiritimatiellia bacterium]|nr:SDR family oxidoreductase [Kiritimatiellia bacterium]
FDEGFFPYIENIVKPHAGDDRILLWDLCNEPFNSARSDETMKTILVWLQRVHRKCKDCGARSPLAVTCDVLDRPSIEHATQATLAKFKTVDILINGAGGSRREATTAPELSFFNIAHESLMKTVTLNYSSAVLPSQVIGRLFAKQKHGVILNIASIAGIRPLTRAIGYSNGKAALINFTQWLAVHMAQEYSPHIRVNALAPGFVLTEQNRFMLTDEKTGQLTERGRQIISQVPMGRLAKPGEMAGAALWLVSDSASFVTGAVIPVDGGFTAISGV